MGAEAGCGSAWQLEVLQEHFESVLGERKKKKSSHCRAFVVYFLKMIIFKLKSTFKKERTVS